MKDYSAIQQNYQTVTSKGYKPVYDYEWFPFVEGLANVGDWQSVVDLSRRIIAENPTNDSYQPFLCQIINKVKTADDPDLQTGALNSLQCTK
jgi:hypothetical protein